MGLLQRILLFKTSPLRHKGISLVVSVLLTTMAISHVISANNDITNIAIAQPTLIESLRGINLTGNQTNINDLVSYSSPNLGFSLEYPSEWEKEESDIRLTPRWYR